MADIFATCPQCGRTYKTGAAYCSQCGQATQEESAAVAIVGSKVKQARSVRQQVESGIGIFCLLGGAVSLVNSLDDLVAASGQVASGIASGILTGLVALAVGFLLLRHGRARR